MDILSNGVAVEIEILEFKSGGNFYGVNVNDIREILPYNMKPTPVPNAHPFIEGIVKPRDFLISIINLMKCLKLKDVDDEKQEMLIVTGINNLDIAIHVDSVRGIHKVLTTDLVKPGKKLSTTVKEAVVGILNRDDRKIEVLEIRKIINEINSDLVLN